MNTTIMGIATALNVIVVLWKLRNDRVLDGIIDGALLAAVMYVFMGSVSGLQMGTIGSAMVSIYLLIDPIKLNVRPAVDKLVETVTLPFRFVWYIITLPYVKTVQMLHAVKQRLTWKKRAVIQQR